MTVTLNGVPREIALATNVAELVNELGLPALVTLVEHNGVALRRDEWIDRPLGDGDCVELIRIAAGG